MIRNNEDVAASEIFIVMTRKEIGKKLDELLKKFAEAKTYDRALLKRLLILAEQIKHFAFKNTKIDSRIKKIYRKFTPGIYFATVYAKTHDFENALQAYKLIETWGGYIQYDDLGYERENEKTKSSLHAVAAHFKTVAMEKIGSVIKRDVLRADKILARYWLTEKKIKRILNSGRVVSDKEIRTFIFQKAESIICYPYLLRQYAEIPKSLARLMTLNQAIFNFYDDYCDLKEDLRDKAPNTLILASRGKIRANVFHAQSKKQIIAILRKEKIWIRLKRIACSFLARAEKIKLPRHYQFWHYLPRYNYEFFDKYFNRLT